MPTDYKRDLPDFDKISTLFQALYKRRLTLAEAKQIQKLWNKIEPEESTIPPKKLF